jgi:hypothetical protein
LKGASPRSASSAGAAGLAFATLVAAALAPRADPAAPPSPGALVTPDPLRARATFAAALAARTAGDLAAYRARLEETRALLPDPSNLWFRVAGARALAGDRTAGFAALEAQLLAGIVRPDFETHADLAPLREHLRWKRLAAAHARLALPLVASEEEFRLPEGGLLVEGIARDPASGAIYLSVVNRRQIVRRASDGSLTLFASLAGTLPGSPLGLAIDAERRRLWVATAGLPYGERLPESERDRGALAAFELASGALVESVLLDGAGHLANDLAVARDGAVYASDPAAGALWRRSAPGKVEQLALSGALVSPGGLALAEDERFLFVADWAAGLAAVELATGELRWLAPPAGSTVLGIDGLARSGGALLAIQNGVAPARITGFELAPDGRSRARAALLERGVPGWDEPTLGVVADGALLYVATSHWPRFGEDGQTVDPSALTPAVVRRLRLESAASATP